MTVSVNGFLPTALHVRSEHHSKTLDAGRDGHTLSCGPTGDILQLSCFHPVHGMIVACPFAQFDGERFHDPEYVRAYRKKLLDYVRNDTRGIGIRFEGEVSDLSASFLDNQWILITYTTGAVDISVTLSVNNHGVVEQSIALLSRSKATLRLGYTLNLEMSVNRASYGQLTEGGPIPIPSPKNHFKVLESGYQWAVVNENLDAVVYGDVRCNNHPVFLDSHFAEESYIGKTVGKKMKGVIELLPGVASTLKSTFRLQPGRIPLADSLYPTLLPRETRGQWKLDNDQRGLIIRRNLEYILGNCTFPVGKDAFCFITDHVALPLGWNRDNYWQIRFLLDVHRNLELIAYPVTADCYASQIQRCVKGHLKWVFQIAQRPFGYWHRSYLANGVPKDGPVFQQDQQCYPLLELCDFYESFPREREFVESILSDQNVSLVFEMLREHRDLDSGLFATEETPGDDAVEYPFHFSSHVLLWHSVKRFSDLLKSFPNLRNTHFAGLENLAEDIRKLTLKNFLGQHPETGEVMFAYLTDGSGQHTFYHDANDIPTLFAPDWGFLDSETHEAWTRTMEFALSPLNVGGFYSAGKFGGLGSVHTRGPWPLGYAQEFVYANLRGNDAGKEDAWRRIKGSMFWDGLFPEAVDCDTGDCVSKAWFSWPGSMIGSALLRFGLDQALMSQA